MLINSIAVVNRNYSTTKMVGRLFSSWKCIWWFGRGRRVFRDRDSFTYAPTLLNSWSHYSNL